MAVTKAISDENRTRLLMFLEGGELCVCQLIELLGLAPSTVSKHMAILYQAGLVESRKEGRWVFYRLATKSDSPPVREAIRFVQRSLKDEPQMVKDCKRLEAVKKMDLDTLCCRYKRS
jgi:DNA-binding transcriptional ArsR family regulator